MSKPEVNVLRDVRLHVQSGHVYDLPLLQWLEGHQPPLDRLRGLQQVTGGLLTVSGNQYSRHKAENQLTVHQVLVRRVVIGRLADFDTILLGTIGLDEVNGQVLLPELTYHMCDTYKSQEPVFRRSRFEISRRSLLGYLDFLRAGGCSSRLLEYQLYPCAVCQEKTLLEPRGSFEICRLCGWEDDDEFSHNDNCGPNHMTLAEGRRLFQEKGTTRDHEDSTYETRRRLFEEVLRSGRHVLGQTLAHWLGQPYWSGQQHENTQALRKTD